jgi:hypothetical protein
MGRRSTLRRLEKSTDSVANDVSTGFKFLFGIFVPPSIWENIWVQQKTVEPLAAARAARHKVFGLFGAAGRLEKWRMAWH